MADLTVYCLVDGESTSRAFSVNITAAGSVYQLKKAIKEKMTPRFNDITANELTLWKVSLPITDDDTPIALDVSNNKKLRPSSKLSKIFDTELPEDAIHIIVQRPPPASKRSLEDAGEESSSKRYRSHTLEDAIISVGLGGRAIRDDIVYLSSLDSKERVLVLKQLGQNIAGDDNYSSLPKEACVLQNEYADKEYANFQKIGDYIQSLELLSAPPGPLFPIVAARDLYIREEYKELYEEITTSFTDTPRSSKENRIFITGTPGIGKSAFLVYFVVRLLAESDDGKPPIIVFQLKQSTTCYVFGGTSVVREGDINVFKDLLDLPETWYLSDSSKPPVLGSSKSIMSASPKTLMDTYKEAAKEGPIYYYMTPWELDELESCRSKVTSFQVVEQEFLKNLYAKIGGIPRYVLQSPSIILGRDKKVTETDVKVKAEAEAYRRVKDAIGSVQDPDRLLECFANGTDSLQFSGQILHQWPNTEHDDYYLKWGSNHIKNEINKRLGNKSWAVVLQNLVQRGREISKGPLFEMFVHHIFRKGGFSFEIKALEDGRVCDPLFIPPNSPVENIRTVAELSTLPIISNFPCIDLALAPDKLFQVTVSLDHPIKQAPLQNIVEAILEKNPKRNTQVGLYFVVPSKIYDDFKVQKYVTHLGETSGNVPDIITRHVKQYALKFNLDSESPGINTSVTGGSGKVRRSRAWAKQ